jgi:hypothetical protein
MLSLPQAIAERLAARDSRSAPASLTGPERLEFRRAAVFLVTLGCVSAVALYARGAFAGIGRHALKSGFAVHPQIAFEPNVGQVDPAALFLERSSGQTVLLEPAAVDFVIARAGWNRTMIRMALLGANTEAKLDGRDPKAGHANYFRGSDPSRWHRQVPLYRRVTAHDLWPGIDGTYYGSDGAFECDFVIAPTADPTRIRFGFDNAEAVVTREGSLTVTADGQKVEFARPRAYQVVDHARIDVPVSYAVDNASHSSGVVAFKLGPYDKRQPLTIDPKLEFSALIGGEYGNFGFGIGVDNDGGVYISGFTGSPNFPVKNAAQSTYGGDGDVFVTKFTPDGSDLVYSTYLGGSNMEGTTNLTPLHMAVDANGSAYVTGLTFSSDFPTTLGAYDTACGTDGKCNQVCDPDTLQCTSIPDAFVTKLNLDGSLAYSTFLGGSGDDEGYAIAIDPTGNAYVTGLTTSTDFPVTPGALQSKLAIGYAPSFDVDAFVAKLSPDGKSLLYATYLGGTSQEIGYGIGVDNAGDAWVTGGTNSTDFPTTAKAMQQVAPGCDSFGTFTCDGFLSEISPDASSLLYSSYLGGPIGTDTGTALKIGSDGTIYIAGVTGSAVFPVTPDAFQLTPAGCFLAKFDPSGTLKYATYLGGSGDDEVADMALGPGGTVFLTGGTTSQDFPIKNALQPTFATSNADAFLTEFDATGSSLVYSTYFSGPGFFIAGFGVAANSAGDAFITGRALDAEAFPITPGAYYAPGGDGSAFVSRISPVSLSGKLGANPSPVSFPKAFFGNAGKTSKPAKLKLNNTNAENAGISAVFPSGDFALSDNSCNGAVPAKGSCVIGLTFTPSALGKREGTLTIVSEASNPILKVPLSGLAVAAPIIVSPTALGFGRVAVSNGVMRQVKLANRSPIDLGISAITSSDPTQFEAGQPCVVTLPKQTGTCSIPVVFRPASRGVQRASIMIVDDALKSPQVVNLVGTGF